MDEPWVCQKCGFTNEYYAAYCVACSAPRADLAPTQVPDEPVDSPDYQPTSGKVPTYKPVPLDTRVPKPAPVGPARPAQDAERPIRPIPHHSRLGLVAVAIVIAIIAGAAPNIFRHSSTTDTVDTFQYGVDVTEPATESPATETTAASLTGTADLAYANSFFDINTAYTLVYNLSRSRRDEWSAGHTTGFPTAEYLVLDELKAFQAQVKAIAPPASAELLALHQTWIAALDRLVTAEQALATHPSQATSAADSQAWKEEDAAFAALYYYWQDNRPVETYL